MSERTEMIVDAITDARWRISNRNGATKLFTYTDLARDATTFLARMGSSETVSLDYVSKVMRGEIKNPGGRKLAAMCAAVGLEPQNV